MNRRELLKQAGVMLAAPYFPPYAPPVGDCSPSTHKDLLVTFVGPFCCWTEPEKPDPTKKQSIRMMAPPIGPDNPVIPHQAWINTTANEIPLVIPPCGGAQSSSEKKKDSAAPCFNLFVPSLRTKIPPMSGTPIFRHPFPKDDGVKPYFNMNVPPPDHVIGLAPVCANIIGADGKAIKHPAGNRLNCPGVSSSSYASGVSFLYKNVDLSKVVLCEGEGECYENGSCHDKDPIFKPCFSNDDCLPMASLVVHLAPQMMLDCDHVHAQAVWTAMQSMFTGLDLKLEFCVGAPQFGGGNDCQDPNMWFP